MELTLLNRLNAYKFKKSGDSIATASLPSIKYSGNWKIGEKIFNNILLGSGILIILVVIGIFISLVLSSIPSIKQFGLNFIMNKTWDPVLERFGALPFITGTLITSFLALAISIPFSISISILLGEYFKRGAFSGFIKSMTELLAGVPSVIYGFWGIFFLVPIVRAFEVKLGIDAYGIGILSSSIILAIMIIPFSASVGREVIELVPADIKEAAYAMGATRYEVIKNIVLPYAKSGIFAGIILSLGRALGETMAVTMLIGNVNKMPTSIFAPANTMASVIANEFSEATFELYISSLIEIGVLLFIVSTIINLIGKWIINRMVVN